VFIGHLSFLVLEMQHWASFRQLLNLKVWNCFSGKL